MKLSPRIFTPADWLKTKPYKHLTAYDNFHIQRCRDLYDLLLDYEDWFAEVEMERDELVELASHTGHYQLINETNKTYYEFTSWTNRLALPRPARLAVGRQASTRFDTQG